MLSIFDLYTLKSKKEEDQIQIIDQFVAFYRNSNRNKLQSILEEETQIDASKYSQQQVILLCILTIYLTDVLAVLEATFRNMYIETFKNIVDHYSIPFDQVFNLLEQNRKFTSEVQDVIDTY